MKIISSSFRDPSGFLFHESDKLYRQINLIYKKHYDYLMKSGLYKVLADQKLLIKHEETAAQPKNENAYKIIRPEIIPFISYPYEWCFSELKDAALLTLKIQKIALEHDMSLKDASAYNIQFLDGKPIFIDTLSFEKYEEGRPWIAYKQFCQHFLAPLVLMKYSYIGLNQLLKIYLDGVPLDLASKLLPWHTRFKFGVLTHIHLHAKAQKYYADKPVKINKKMSRRSFFALIDNLESFIKQLSWKPSGTEWADYYDKTIYYEKGLAAKKLIINRFLNKIAPKTVWDMGANTGFFSRIASKMGVYTIAFDIDPSAVEKNYLECKEKNETRMLPLLLDITNPSPDIGWENNERRSLINRGPADCAMALALIHHLAISNNTPFEKIARFFSRICHYLIIEFVPKNDPNVKRLLATRRDIFTDYTEKKFEYEFKRFFGIIEKKKIKNTERVVYLMKKI